MFSANSPLESPRTPKNVTCSSNDSEFSLNISGSYGQLSHSLTTYLYLVHDYINDSSTPLTNNSEGAYLQTPTKSNFKNIFAATNSVSSFTYSPTLKEQLRKIDNSKVSSSNRFLKPRCLLNELMAEHNKAAASITQHIPKIRTSLQKNRDFKIFDQALIFKSDETCERIRCNKQKRIANERAVSTKFYNSSNRTKKNFTVFKDDNDRIYDF